MGRQTVLDAFLKHADERPDATAALVKQKGAFAPVTWGQMRTRAERISAALIRWGIQPGDRVAIMMATSLDWTLVDLGVVGAGAISVPIYTSNLADECHFIMADSGAKLVFCDESKNSRKFFADGEGHASLRQVVQIDGALDLSLGQAPPAALAPGAMPPATPGVGYTSLTDFCAHVAVDTATLEHRRQEIPPDSPYSIIYTSGTTGRPKGVICTHDNMLYEIEALEQIELLRIDDIELLFLPLAHVFSRVLQVVWLGIGHIMAFAESMNTIREDVVLARPHIMVGVPRVFEKFYVAVLKKAHERGPTMAAIFDRALALSERVGRGGATPVRAALERAELALYRRTLFAQVSRGLRASLGGRMRLMVSGGAPLAPKIAHFFADAELTILEGFGLTETMGGTVFNRPERNRIGSVGLPLPGTSAKLAEDGELLLRGRGVSPGYWQNDAATQETRVDGWLKTGDIATIDAEGCITIVDRKKDLIVTAGGKNIAPQNIENMFKSYGLIGQAMVHGDKRNYLTALITLDAEALQRFAEERKLGAGSYAELTQRPEVQAEVARIVATCNAQLARYETIKKYRVMPQEFTIESGEMTASLKLKRREINKRYGHIFDAFYAEQF